MIVLPVLVLLLEAQALLPALVMMAATADTLGVTLVLHPMVVAHKLPLLVEARVLLLLVEARMLHLPVVARMPPCHLDLCTLKLHLQVLVTLLGLHLLVVSPLVVTETTKSLVLHQMVEPPWPDHVAEPLEVALDLLVTVTQMPTAPL